MKRKAIANSRPWFLQWLPQWFLPSREALRPRFQHEVRAIWARLANASLADCGWKEPAKPQDILLSPDLKPPELYWYGMEVCQFVASPVYRFNGKPWQLRTLKSEVSGKLFVFPVVVDTGGVKYETPLISNGVLKKLFPEKSIRDINDEIRFQYRGPRLTTFPNPLDDSINAAYLRLRSPLSTDSDDLRDNMVGQELAEMIITRSNNLGRRKRGLKTHEDLQFIKKLAIEVGVSTGLDVLQEKANEDALQRAVEREVEAMLAIPANSVWPELRDSLPMPPCGTSSKESKGEL